jgi:hypothetical protein
MNQYTTLIHAVCPHDGQIKTYFGPNIPAISFADAEDYCERNGLGYCKVLGLLVAEVSEDGHNINHENLN